MLIRAHLLHAKACLQLINIVEDECSSKTLSPQTTVLRRNANALDRLNYLQPRLLATNRVEDVAERVAVDSVAYGTFDELTMASNGEEFVASGRAVLPHRNEPADAVLLTYRDRGGAWAIFAISHTEIIENRSIEILRRGVSAQSSWRKTFSPSELPVGADEVCAWAFDAETGKAYKLTGTHSVPRVN